MWALAGWLSWSQCYPVHQKADGLIPGQSTYLDCRFDFLARAHMGGNQLMFVFSLSQINKHWAKILKNSLKFFFYP